MHNKPKYWEGRGSKLKYTLKNEDIIVEVDSFGAELKSVKSIATGCEYMWQADPKFWARTSPVLFPIVGGVRNKEFFVDGKRYPMGQHGFARDMEHTLISRTDNSILFELKSSDETILKYPFPFVLNIGYELKNNGVKVIWEVKNPSEDDLPFSIGAHPAFLCPTDERKDKSGYKFSFGKYDEASSKACATSGYSDEFSTYISVDMDAKLIPLSEIHHHGNTRDTGLAILTEDITLPLENGLCSITPDFFDRCTYMIENNQANSVGIVDPNGNEYVQVIFDTPLFAIWSPEEKNAPFLCIEPWYGRADSVDYEGEFKDREHINILKGKKAFHSEYVMKFK